MVKSIHRTATRRLPDEDIRGLLQYSFAGTADAAQSLEDEIALSFARLGLSGGDVCPCVWKYRAEGHEILTRLHRDWWWDTS